jgi:hypothetical protein
MRQISTVLATTVITGTVTVAGCRLPIPFYVARRDCTYL